MQSSVDKKPVDSITEELERPLLDQFSTKSYSSDEDTSDTYVSEPMFEDDPSMTTDTTDVTLYASSCPDFECMRGTPVIMFEEGHTDVIRRHDTRSTRSCPSVICIRDTHVIEPMYEECSTMTSEIARDTYVAPPCIGDLESGRKAAPQQPPQENTIGDLESGRKAAPQQPPQENTGVNSNQVFKHDIGDLESGRKAAPQQPPQENTIGDLESGRKAAPQQPPQENTIHDILRNHLKSAPQVAPPQTDIGDLESGRKAAPQQPPQENTIGDLESGRKAAPQQPPQENTIGDLNKGHEATPQQTKICCLEGDHIPTPHQARCQIENLNMEWGDGSAVFFPAQRQIENHDVEWGDETDVEWGHEADPQQTQRLTKIHDILMNHRKSAPQVAPPQTDIGDLESGRKAALQQPPQKPPQENTIGDLNKGHEATPKQSLQQSKICCLEGDHIPTPHQARWQIEDLNMKWGHGSAPFSQVQRQTENLNIEWGDGSAVFFPAQRQIENHDVEWRDEADVEWGHEVDPRQTQRQTKVDDPASDVIYMVRLLLAMYMIVLPYLGWGHGSDRRQTENHDVEGGTGPDPQQTRRQTKVDDPASDVMYMVRSLLIIYNLMLAYLGWGPTSQSPRQKYMILYWVSIGMLAYAIIAVLVVLKLYKMGGAWTWWATFFRYTISLAALIGCVVLLVFVSRH